jgi:chromosome segregation ATPase
LEEKTEALKKQLTMENNIQQGVTPEIKPKKDFLPEWYNEISEPFFRGKGDHSVSELEGICESYKEYAHQADIAFYSCSRQLVKAENQLSSLTTELEQKREEVESLKNVIAG